MYAFTTLSGHTARIELDQPHDKRQSQRNLQPRFKLSAQHANISEVLSICPKINMW